jgi:hypothetical protein
MRSLCLRALSPFRRSHRLALSVLWVASVVVGGCASDDSVMASRRPLPWSGNEPGVSSLARLAGTIEGNSSAGCVWVRDLVGPHAVLWPSGFTVSFDPLTVYGSDGQVVARQGDRVLASGGEYPAGSVAIPNCDAGVSLWVFGTVGRDVGT